jgi:serine/threonine protein kinase
MLDAKGNVKIIDFGFSTCIPNDKKIKIFCGTPSYMAPEIVAKKNSVVHPQTFGPVESFYLPFSVGVSLLEDKMIRIFIRKS